MKVPSSCACRGTVNAILAPRKNVSDSVVKIPTSVFSKSKKCSVASTLPTAIARGSVFQMAHASGPRQIAFAGRKKNPLAGCRRESVAAYATPQRSNLSHPPISRTSA